MRIEMHENEAEMEIEMIFGVESITTNLDFLTL